MESSIKNWLNPVYLAEKKQQQIKEQFVKNKPFSHYIFEDFLLRGGFPEIVNLEINKAQDYVYDTVINKIVFKDIPSIFKISNPDILFIVIGKILDKKFIKIKKANNILHYQEKNSKELVDYYNSADLGLFVQRFQGGGLGFTSEECLACGVPAMNRYWKGVIASKALITVPINSKKVKLALKNHFEKSSSEIKKLEKIARNYIINNYSDDIWKDKYIKEYTN